MKVSNLNIATEDYSLLTDLYQLTMSACYQGEKIENAQASFEMFVRSLPPNYGYLIAMGLTQVLEYLENLSFNSEQIEYLKRTGIFNHVNPQFWELLANCKFCGDLWAVPEGTAIFPHEPFLRVSAPLWQCQLIETYLLTTINYQTLIATRAARMRDIAGKEAILLEFGTRRAFSPQGALWAGRAAISGGFNATSNVLTAFKLGLKPSGTMAHALVMAIRALEGSEDDAFFAFQRYFPQAPLLIDTYDTLAATQRLSQRVKKGEMSITGVRLDSGDLVTLSKQVRSQLGNITIFASGDLDEWEIERLKKQGAQIDGYGLGTRLVTGTPVNGVYKLVEINDIPTMKLSNNKKTFPGKKQIFRQEIGGKVISDRLGLWAEKPLENEAPLLIKFMENGERLLVEEDLSLIQERTLNSVEKLPLETRKITQPELLNVIISEELESLRLKLMAC